MNIKVSFDNVSKKYNLEKNKKDKIKDLFLGRKSKSEFYGVRNISFNVLEGETIGFVGVNGSGKSTMSNLLAKTIPPTSGNITMDGQPSLIAIAAGLNNSLTGKDNIYLKCLMMGFSNKQIDAMYQSIVDFADIGEFIDQPVKNYSSGMKSRLGFAISVHNDPDILIIDEALSVGDQTFYQKCVDKITEFKKQGKTIFFVSHSISQIEKICDRVAWMHYGKLIMIDETKVVVAEYKKYINWFNRLAKEHQIHYQNTQKEERRKPLKQEELGRKKSINNKLKKSWSRKIQVIMAALLLLLSVFGLFYGKAIEQEWKDNRKQEASKKPEEDAVAVTDSWHPLDKGGVIITQDAALYNDNMTTELSNKTLSFGQEVHLVSQNSTVTEIALNDDHGKKYIKNEDVSLKITENKSITPATFAPYFSDNVVNSYEFLFQFIGSSVTDLEASLYNAEQTDYNGMPAIYLETENIYYLIEQEVVTAIVIVDVPEISPTDINIEEQDFIYDKEKNMFLVKAENMQFIVNNGEKTLTIQSI